MEPRFIYFLTVWSATQVNVVNRLSSLPLFIAQYTREVRNQPTSPVFNSVVTLEHSSLTLTKRHSRTASSHFPPLTYSCRMAGYAEMPVATKDPSKRRITKWLPMKLSNWGFLPNSLHTYKYTCRWAHRHWKAQRSTAHSLLLGLGLHRKAKYSRPSLA